ncbi:MAG: hypothetical protein V7693_16285 [Halopseudomonas sabulinigri]
MQLSTVQNTSVFDKLMSGAWLEHPLLLENGMAVLKSNDFTCTICGFKSKPSIGLDNPHGWLIPGQMSHAGYLPVTKSSSKCYCPFCISSLAINWGVTSNIQNGRETAAPGMLISFSGISQIQLNRLSVYIVSVLCSQRVGNSGGGVVAVATAINSAMKSRQLNLQSDLPVYIEGQDSSFARSLALLPEHLYESRSKVMHMVRWWPNYEYWLEQGNYWNKTTFSN